MDKRRNSYLYLSIACLTLFSGYLVYFFGRPGAIIYAIPTALEHWITVLPVFAEVSGPLPGFFHSYAFILLTFVVLGNCSRAYLYLSIRSGCVLKRCLKLHSIRYLTNRLRVSFPPGLKRFRCLMSPRVIFCRAHSIRWT